MFTNLTIVFYLLHTTMDTLFTTNDIKKHIEAQYAKDHMQNKIINEFVNTTNACLAKARESSQEVQRYNPQLVPVKSDTLIPEHQFNERESNKICEDFTTYYQLQGYIAESEFNNITRLCTVQFADAFNCKYQRPPRYNPANKLCSLTGSIPFPYCN
jgi:hypothetical protein